LQAGCDDFASCFGQFPDRDKAEQRRVFYKADELAGKGGQDSPKGLWKNDIPHGLNIRHSQ